MVASGGAGWILHDYQVWSATNAPQVTGNLLTVNGNTVTISSDHALGICGIANTGSMLPVVGAGHYMILDTHFDPVSLQVGDIVTFRLESDGKITGAIHRIHAIKDGLFQMKGDNNPFPDPGWYPASSIDALVVGIVY